MQRLRQYTLAFSGFALIALCAGSASAGDFFHICKHFKLADPPRGEVAVSMPGLLNMDTSLRSRAEVARKQAAKKEEEAAKKMTGLEKDVSELAKLVKAMVKEEANQKQNMTQMSRLVKSMVGAQVKQQKDLEELSRLVKGIVDKEAAN